MLCCGPHDLEVDGKIAMYEDMAHGPDVGPRHRWMSLGDRVGQRYGGLADDLDVMDDSIHRSPIAGESLVVETLDVRCDAIDRLLDILEPQPPNP